VRRRQPSGRVEQCVHDVRVEFGHVLTLPVVASSLGLSRVEHGLELDERSRLNQIRHHPGSTA